MSTLRDETYRAYSYGLISYEELKYRLECLNQVETGVTMGKMFKDLTDGLNGLR